MVDFQEQLEVLHRSCSPEAAVGGPVALVKNGDIIEIDAVKELLILLLMTMN